MRIRALPQNVANLIAAGEVIERPATALKELLENALDATATAIEVDINDGGITCLRVQDNGCGIVADDLPLAFARHATSKIRAADDLPDVTTFGFRGEAIASLAAVADVRITSRTKDHSHGFEYALHLQQPQPTPSAVGTSVTARGLFADVPARRRFLHTPATEAGHCVAVVTQTALASHAIAFNLSVNDRPRLTLPQTDNFQSRLTALFPALTDNLLQVEENAGGFALHGAIFAPALGNSGKRFGQFFYVNGRFVRDRLLRRAVGDCLRTVAHGGDPGYVLFLQTPSGTTDVNVHPAKLEVRFTQPRAVFDFIRQAVNKTLAQPLALPVRDDGWMPPQHAASQPPPLPFTTNANDNQQAMQAWQLLFASPPAAMPDTPPNRELFERLPPEAPLGRALGQLHDIYIIAENQSGLIIVDMHAAHERLLYEELKTAADGTMPMQAFLTPPEIPLSDLQAATLRDHGDSIIGVTATMIDERTATITAISSLLAELADATTLLTDILDDLANFGEGSNATIRRDFILSSVSCHAAVRANRRLTLSDMNTLLRRMEQSERSGFCNHGRPCWQQIDRQYFDRVFHRGK